MTDAGKGIEHALHNTAQPYNRPAPVNGEEGETSVSLPPFITQTYTHDEFLEYLRNKNRYYRSLYWGYSKRPEYFYLFMVALCATFIETIEEIQTIYSDMVLTAEGESTNRGGGVIPSTVDRTSIGG